ncbi:unnamed protein product [Closterium sp. NIES-54]
MFITLYFIVTCLPDSLCHSAVGAARGTLRPPFFEGCSPSPLAPSYASAAAAAADVSVAEDVEAASASGSGSGGGGNSLGSGGSRGGGGSWTGGGSGGSGGGGGSSGGSGGSGGGGTGGSRTGLRHGGPGGGQRQQQQRWSETQSPHQLSDAEGDCYQCVSPDPGIAAAALGASDFGTLPGTAPAQALHTFTLDSSASRCFFRDSTTLTPLLAPVPVRLADPSGGSVVARSSTVLPCPAVPSDSLSGLHLPSFSMNLVSTAALQDSMVTTTTPGGQRVSICTCTRTGRHLAMFTRRPGSSLYTLARASSGSCISSGAHIRSLPPLPPSPAPHCLLCVEGRQRAAPHSSLFPPTTAPLQTLHMDVWGPACERYLLLVVDNYTRYTTVFPLRSKGEVVDVLISWILTVRLQLRERFGQDLPVLRLHSDRGGEISSNLLRDFCHGEGILQSFTLPESPQQNGIAERRIGLVMELNLWPRVSLPKTSPTLRWTGEVGDASVFRVWGSRAFVRDTSADKLSARAIPCVFLGFIPDTPDWQFCHPTSCCVVPSQDVTFDKLVPFCRVFPYCSDPPPSPPLFLTPGPPPVDPLPPQGPAPSGVSQVDPLPGTAPVELAVGSGAASRGAEPGGAGSEGAGSGGAEPGGEDPWGAEPEGVEHGVAESEGAESGGAELRGAGDAGAGGAEVTAGAGGTGGTAATRAAGTSVGGTGAVGAGAVGAGAVDPGAGGAGGTVRPRPYFVPLLQQLLGVPSSPGLTPPRILLGGYGRTQPLTNKPFYPSGLVTGILTCCLVTGILPAPSPYTEQPGGLTERREPASRPFSPVRTARRVPRSCPPPVPGTHAMALRPSFFPLCVPLSATPESSLPEVPDPESDRARAASPTVHRLLATAVTGPSFDSATASALVSELLDFVAACRLDYATALVAESASASPPSVGGECALGTDILEDRQEEFECLAAAVPCFASMLLAHEGGPDAPDIPIPCSDAEAITGPYSSQWQAVMDAEMASWKSTGTYVDEVPPPWENIVDGMWIFRVKRPPSSPPAFKARYVTRGFSQQQGVDYFQSFSPIPKMTTLRVLLHVAAQRDYELHSLDFSTAFLQGSLHEEIWLRRPPGFTGSFPAVAALGFAPSTADPSLFLCTGTSLPPFYDLAYVDDLVKSELQKRHTCTDLGELRIYLGLQITRDRAQHTTTLTQSHMVHQVLRRFGLPAD